MGYKTMGRNPSEQENNLHMLAHNRSANILPFQEI